MIVKATKETGICEPIPGYDGIYEIDTFGNIEKVKGSKCGTMKPSIKNGSLVIQLTDASGKRKWHKVYKLVQLTFLGPAPPGKVVYRKNGDKLDVCVNNLAFISRQDLGRMTGAKSGRKAVLKLDEDDEIVEVYSSARKAGRENYMSYQTVMDRCNGKVKSKLAPDGYRYIWDNDYDYEEEV